jgi:hypothetical protein
VGDLLDVLGGCVEQLVTQLGQHPGRGELVADLRHVSIVRAEPGRADPAPFEKSSSQLRQPTHYASEIIVE